MFTLKQQLEALTISRGSPSKYWLIQDGNIDDVLVLLSLSLPDLIGKEENHWYIQEPFKPANLIVWRSDSSGWLLDQNLVP